MKFLLTTIIFLFSLGTTNQENAKIVGDWKGALTLPNGSLSIIFHIKEEDGKLSATMDSPDQNAFGYAMDEITFKEGKLNMKIHLFGGSYEGFLKEGKLDGKWSQGGQSLDLNMVKEVKK